MYWKVMKVLIGLAIATLCTYFVLGWFGALIIAGVVFLLVPFDIFVPGIANVVMSSEWTFRILFALIYYPVLKFVLEEFMAVEIPSFRIFQKKQGA